MQSKTYRSFIIEATTIGWEIYCLNLEVRVYACMYFKLAESWKFCIREDVCFFLCESNTNNQHTFVTLKFTVLYSYYVPL